MIKFGTEVKDKVSGFLGQMTGYCVYQYANTQYQITPTSVNTDGTVRAAQWFDVERVVVVQTKKVGY